MIAEELRIGNWVRMKNSFPMKVTGCYRDVVYLDFEGNEGDEWEVNVDEVFPVEITQEILEKNGFEKNFFCCIMEQDHSEYITRFVRHIGEAKIMYIPEQTWLFADTENEEINSYDTRFVHELQNKLEDVKLKIEIEL